MEKDPDYTVFMHIEDVHLLHHCVKETIEKWPGSPARPAEEQEHLWQVRDWLYRMILEHKFNNS